MRKRLNLSLEADENLYGGSPLRIEPVAKQWLERASLDWQLSRDAAHNEFYVVYGDPNSLATTPALFVKLIRYIGAEKGT